MKAFFKYLIEILLITLIISFGIQYLSDNGLRNLKNSRYNDWENILQGKINSDVIINGSSRGDSGFNPRIIGNKLNSSCFNISYNAGKHNLQQYKFDIYIKNNKKPKIVIQNIDLAYFLKSVEIPYEFEFYPFVYYEDINSLVSKFDNKFNSKFNWFKVIPLLKYNQSFKMFEEGIIANFSSSVSKNAKTIQGYCPQNRPFKIDYGNLNKFSLIKKKSKNEKEIALLYEMVKFYKSRLGTDAKVIFVWMPEHKLRLSKNYDLKRESILEELSLIQKKNKNFYFIDMAYDDISNHDEYYFDTFHVNETGSNVFSEKVSEKIYNILN